MTTPSAPDVRERSRELLRSELADAAADYCAAHGIDEVTVDEVAQGIGISRATFFRYFGSKEDAVVLAARLVRPSLADQVAAQPDPADGLAWSMLRDAMSPTVAAVQVDPDRVRSRIRMIAGAPALRARLAYTRSEEQARLHAALTERLGDALTARAVAAAAMGAIDLAWSTWTADEGSDLGAHLDRAFAAVAAAPSATLT